MNLRNKIKKNLKNKGVRVFFVRLALFFVLFIVIFKGLPDITKIIYRYRVDNYQPYFLYLMYPIVLLFVILRWNKIKDMRYYGNNLLQTLLFTILAASTFLLPLKNVFLAFPDIPHQFIYYFPLMIGFSFLFIAIFGLKFVKEFSSELFLVVYLFALYLVSQVLIEVYWMHFSKIILYALGFILPFISKSVSIVPAELLVKMENFNVNVGAPCSGIYSLVTFLFLFIASILFLKDKSRINVPRATIALVVGLILVFILNIIRIAIIIYVGAFYSEELAINLFHEYLSAIFLLGLFILYLYFVFPLIIKKK